MKKSEIYLEAMRCVVNSGLNADLKIRIIAQLSDDKKTAEWSEKKEVAENV